MVSMLGSEGDIRVKSKIAPLGIGGPGKCFPSAQSILKTALNKMKRFYLILALSIDLEIENILLSSSSYGNDAKALKRVYFN